MARAVTAEISEFSQARHAAEQEALARREAELARERRTLDFTAPDGPGDGLRPDPVHPGRTAGGAAIFHDRLTGPIRAAAEAGLPVDPARRTLWGHSFGGLFTLYALLARPGGFARYAAISPSISIWLA